MPTGCLRRSVLTEHSAQGTLSKNFLCDESWHDPAPRPPRPAPPEARGRARRLHTRPRVLSHTALWECMPRAHRGVGSCLPPRMARKVMRHLCPLPLFACLPDATWPPPTKPDSPSEEPPSVGTGSLPVPITASLLNPEISLGVNTRLSKVDGKKRKQNISACTAGHRRRAVPASPRGDSPRIFTEKAFLRQRQRKKMEK